MAIECHGIVIEAGIHIFFIVITIFLLFLSHNYAKSVVRYHQSFVSNHYLYIFLFGPRKSRPSGKKLVNTGKYQFENFKVNQLSSAEISGVIIKPSEVTQKFCFILNGYNRVYGDMDKEALAFCSIGYNVVLFDYIGAGFSGHGKVGLGLKEAYELNTVMKYIQGKYKVIEFIGFGHSMGGMTILWHEKIFGKCFDKVILEAVYTTLRTTLCNRFKVFKIPSFPLVDMVLIWIFLIDNIPYWKFSLDYLLFKKNKQNYLFLHGLEDRKSLYKQVQFNIMNKLGATMKPVKFPGAEHEALVRKNERLWKQSVENFLSLG